VGEVYRVNPKYVVAWDAVLDPTPLLEEDIKNITDKPDGNGIATSKQSNGNNSLNTVKDFWKGVKKYWSWGSRKTKNMIFGDQVIIHKNY